MNRKFDRAGLRHWALNIGLCALLLAGCAVGPDYKRPAVHEPPAFRGETLVTTNSFGDLPWWQVFHDETLQLLIRTALTNNYDVRIAFTRIEQERQLVRQARAGFFPQVNYSAVVGESQNAIPGSTAVFKTANSSEVTLVDGTLTASWEIDLFGRIRRLTEAQRAQYFASVEARRDVSITLISQLAQNYFQLLALDSELAIARDETNAYAGSFKIFAERLQHGAASKLETSAAEALFESAAATIPELELQIAQVENQISILLGENPHAIIHEHSRLENQDLPELPAGLPSSLLERRPDIREAEQSLRSANAQVGVAKADFFPQVNLSGLIGQASSSFTIISGSAMAWTAAAGLTGPLFQGGRLRAQYRQALAARDQFALQYQYSVRTALQEVSNALIAREKLAQARIEHARAVAAYQQAVRIVIQRYLLGQSSYYEVLQEQQLLYPEENTLVQTEYNQLAAIVQLYVALGGGWQVEEKKQ